MAMTKCKECGSAISSKAEACPKCGFRLKPKPSGCVVGLFKMTGGLIGAIVALVLVTGFLRDNEKSSVTHPIQELEMKCKALADSYPNQSERGDVYSSCVTSGKAALKAHGIN